MINTETWIQTRIHMHMLWLNKLKKQFNSIFFSFWQVESTAPQHINDMFEKYWLTHWGCDKMVIILQMTFWNALMKMHEFRLKFHGSLFLGFQFTMCKHWFKWWFGADQATSHYLNQWWLVYKCIYASPGLNELIQSIPNDKYAWIICIIFQTNCITEMVLHVTCQSGLCTELSAISMRAVKQLYNETGVALLVDIAMVPICKLYNGHLQSLGT